MNAVDATKSDLLDSSKPLFVDRLNEINTKDNAYDYGMYDGEEKHRSLLTSLKYSDGAEETKQLRIQEVGQKQQVTQFGCVHRNG